MHSDRWDSLEFRASQTLAHAFMDDCFSIRTTNTIIDRSISNVRPILSQSTICVNLKSPSTPAMPNAVHAHMCIKTTFSNRKGARMLGAPKGMGRIQWTEQNRLP